MKNIFIFAFLAAALTSCIDYYPEPRYDSRSRMIGSYSFEEYSETYREYVYYRVHVSESRYHDQILISNFYGSDISIYAYVDGTYLTIPFQVVNGFEVEGSGHYTSGDLHLSYSVRDRYAGTRTDYCETLGYRR